MNESARIDGIFATLGSGVSLHEASGLAVTSPRDGAMIARLMEDVSPEAKIGKARAAQAAWSLVTRAERERIIGYYAAALKANREPLAEAIHLEAGKTMKESLGEVDAAAEVLLRTIKEASLPELSGMLRTKERPPVGTVGLITSFNFPFIVAHWTLAPAFLGGNAVLWKPSEKTPLSALAGKAVFDKAFGKYADLLQILVGGRDAGAALVMHEQVDMISATGSVAMGQFIRSALAKKNNRGVPPILELGGNNGVIISESLSQQWLEWAVGALMNSFLGTTGQRCTNTRRLIVHRHVYDRVVALLKAQIDAFLAATIKGDHFDPDNVYGYGALVDENAFTRFEQAKAQVKEEGGEVVLGKRLFKDKFQRGYYVEPALALLPVQRSPKSGASSIMYVETFAPILFVVPYDGGVDAAIELLNAPVNAGLVGAIYTQSQQEADLFALRNQAGHSLINSPKGTGTPAYCMGFGGNGESGSGEILNAADPLRPFTRDGSFRRIAQNKDVPMDTD